MDQNWENLFQGKILERGWNYYKTGKVDNFTVTDERISAVVEGTEYYHVDIELNQGEINGMYCSCPYAADGKNCKHMAAVLYAAAHEDNEDEGDFYDEDEDYVEYEYDYEQREYLSDLKELIVNADRKDLEKMLLTIAGNDKSTGKAIYKFLETDRVLKEKRATVKVTMRSLKAKADYIFSDHSDRSGFIDYREAFDFESDCLEFIDENVRPLVESGAYMDAFNISTYLFVELGSCDIDDDGEIWNITNECYDVWKSIAASCSEEEKAHMKEWFQAHEKDDTVIDYMEDIIHEFLTTELATREELISMISDLDAVIESKNKNLTDSNVGCIRDRGTLVLRRMEFMKRLGTSDEEIEAYRYAHRKIQMIRDQYIAEAKTAGDTLKVIELLKESREDGKTGKFGAANYGRDLAEQYHKLGDTEKEREELLNSFEEYGQGNLDDFKEIRGLCGEEEWPKFRDRMICSVKSKEKKCALLAEEKLKDQLYALIAEGQEISLLDRYGFLLADAHGTEILKAYEKYVCEVASTVRNESGYNRLIGYLKRMCYYEGGRETTKRLAEKWREAYPTRKLMVQTLTEFIDQI